ncbi:MULTISPECIES: hypothetical protein [Kitasatospora]|uniref:Lipoprotein n=1 Tax=Kitasatospora setae (strain ATCC 33774 / DSM 43861 / JCM 3304 / KCC A-0304 / NBRC 14216 / KM-6054) TaxID=452652 RepID=E4NJD5_KITSK|nr:MULTISPECIES: hypothetical protein [Kitasatospora]BAJ33083.1 hypothetical protein KSE_73280 [Kitasatospora setae KM-6054]
MIRPTLSATAATLAVAALLGGLTGCGSTRAAGSSGAPGAQTSAQAEAQRQYAEQRRQAEAAHDRAFPAVAAACAGKEATMPPSTPAAGSSGGHQPENPKYGENHAYLKMTSITPLQQCRGNEHASRLSVEAARQPPAGPEQAKALLTRLGYPEARVGQSADGVRFSFSVPGVGPCLSGVLSATPRIEVHGAYVEGGCETPQGGH